LVDETPGFSSRITRRGAIHTSWDHRDNLTGVYFTDRGIEELASRRGEEQVSLEWLAAQLRTFVDVNPELETPIERLATWLARLDDDED